MMADATLMTFSQQRALVDAQLIDAALTVPVESDVSAMTTTPLISQPPLDFTSRLILPDSPRSGGTLMTDVEIKNRIRQQLLSGIDISSALPSVPGQTSHVTVCVTLSHHCAACGGDKPHYEFNPDGSRICLHDRCYWLWRDVETDR